MSPSLISLIDDPPPGFITGSIGKRQLLSGTIVLLAPSCEEAYALLPDFQARVEGVVVTIGMHEIARIGPLLWHVGLSRESLAHAGDLLALVLDVIAGSGTLRNQAEVAKRAEARLQSELEVRLQDYLRVTGSLQEQVAELARYRDHLEHQKDLLQSVLEHVPIRVFWKDTELRYLGCNSPFAHDAGLGRSEDVIGKTDFDMGWRDQAERYRANDHSVMESGIPKLDFEEPQTTPDGRIIWLRTSKVPLRGKDRQVIGILGVYADITQSKQDAEELDRHRRHLEQLVEERTEKLRHNLAELEKAHATLKEMGDQLRQSEKMASIGQLAAGVAHEINNPVGFVNSNLNTLRRYLVDLFEMLSAYERAEEEVTPETRAALAEQKRKIDLAYVREDSESLLTESLDGLGRVKRIVQDLKDFSHVDETDKQWADLEKGMDSTLNVVWNEIKYKADVVKEYGGIPDIECIPSQINQVFMNLLVNAAQAIEGRGKITIRTGQEGQNVWVEVADTGIGIQPEHLSRIFEPFFTTKPVGKGTGLGLSLSYGIVSKHNGHIDVKSESGKGTAFRVWLPSRQSVEI